MRIGVVACGSHLTRMWSYRLSHAVSPLFHMCYSAFSHVLCMRITCNFIACHMWKSYCFTCDSHGVHMRITCDMEAHHMWSSRLFRMEYACKPHVFHMWKCLFSHVNRYFCLFSHVKSPVYHMCVACNLHAKYSKLHVTNIPRSHVNIGLSHVITFFSHVICMCFTCE